MTTLKNLVFDYCDHLNSKKVPVATDTVSLVFSDAPRSTVKVYVNEWKRTHQLNTNYLTPEMSCIAEEPNDDDNEDKQEQSRMRRLARKIKFKLRELF